MIADELVQFEEDMVQLFEQGEIHPPNKIPCEKCGKQISKRSKTLLD